MKLPADCPYAVTSPERILGDVIEAVPCCRAHCLFRSLGDGEVPLCRSWGTEVYRFTWDSFVRRRCRGAHRPVQR